MAVRDPNKDPYLSFRFGVKFGDEKVAGFSEVTGLQVEIEVEEYREGGLNEYVHRFAGKTRYPSHLVLKHGLVHSTTLWDWLYKTAQGEMKRKNISVILYDREGNPNHEGNVLYRWNFKQAYPVRWSGPDLRAGTAEVALETLELVHNGFAKA